MAVRPYWKGYLKLSLVTCAVTLSPATTEGNRVRFHTLNRTTGDRIYTRYVDAETGRTVDDDHQVKAYEKAEDEFVILEDEELDAVKLDSVRTIDIDEFVEADTVEWTYFDTPYFVVPADEVGEEAFSVIREAMASTGTVGISRLVLYRRERAVMLEPRGKGIVLWTLRYGDEVREEKEYFAGLKEAKPDAKALTLVKTLIKERTKPWNPKMADDPVQSRLLEIIAAKKKGRKRPAKAKTPPPTSGNVINIMDALRKSIKAEGKGK